MDRKIIFGEVYKNKILILCCAVLITGSVFGISVLRLLPENIATNIYAFLSRETSGFFNLFLNNFCFPAAVLTAVYFAGFSLLGNFTVHFIMFMYGIFYTFINGINYMFCGAEYFINSVIIYFTLMLYYGFMLIIFGENAVYSSNIIKNCLKNTNPEKSHYKAKKLTVKFISFTAVLAFFSLFSAYISVILQQVL